MKFRQKTQPSQRWLGFPLLLGVVLSALHGGCAQKDEDAALSQTKVVFSKAQEFASSAWKSASDQASKLTADSGKQTLLSAQSKLEEARKQLSAVKAPSNLDSLKLDSLKGQLNRIEAALEIKKLKAEMDQRVSDAQKLKENAQKSVDQVRERIVAVDNQYKALARQLQNAQATYDSAGQKIQIINEKIKDL